MNRKNLLLVYIFAFMIIGMLLIIKNEKSHTAKENTVMYSVEENNSESETESDTSTQKSQKTTKTKSTKATKTTKVSTEIEKETKAELHLPLDINKASYEELCGLSGIGDKLAQEIIAYREQNGGFNNIEEILNVYGIGENIFENIKENIFVENPVYPEIEEETEEVKVEENEQIEETVEHIEETEPPLTLEDVAPIDLNTADAELLMLLPHVDEEIAEKILKLREELHVISSPYELLYVEGLSRQQVSEIFEYVYVEQNSD